ncbi:MAG: hypothetical protein K2G85_02565 [Muribaculaceae bacterium]|nr:hypothetical protein [Muribaculaceae bacterium]
MNDILTNVTMILSIVCAIITTIFVINTIRESRNEAAEAKDADDKIKSEIGEYDRILAATHELEFNREKNKGQHFEDESVYIHRANQIRVNSRFFSWVKK